MKILIAVILIMLFVSSVHAEQIRDLGKKVNWNENNGKTKDFILTVRYKEDGIIFCPSFIVHPMERDEDFPKDMERVVINEPGLKPRCKCPQGCNCLHEGKG